MKERAKGFMQIIKGLGVLFIVLLLVMAFFGAFDNEAEDIGNAEIFRGNDTKSVFSGESQVRVTEDGEEEGEESPKENAANGAGEDSSYLQTGYTYKLQNGSNFTITNVGIIYDFSNRSTIGYAMVEYTNNSEDMICLEPDDISAFVDDFQESVDTRVPIMIDNVEYHGETLTIDPGRKGRYVYFTLFPAGGETAEKIEISLFGGSILFKENGQWLYADERADAIKAQTQAYMESVEEQREWNERYESLPLGVMCPDEFYGAYIDTQTGMVEGPELLEVISGEYVNTTTKSTTIATVGENGTMSLRNGIFEFDNLGLYQDLSGAYSIDAEANYKVGFLGSGYIYIWTPDEIDPDNVDEGFYKKID